MFVGLLASFGESNDNEETNMDTNVKLLKKRIEGMVKLYKLLHKKEYDAVVEMVKQKRKYVENDGKIDSKIVKRALMEYPEILLDMLEKSMDRDEYSWFTSMEGVKYFSKVCPEFLLIKKV